MAGAGVPVLVGTARSGADRAGHPDLAGDDEPGWKRSVAGGLAFLRRRLTGDYPVELPDESLLGKHLLEATLQSPTMGRALPVLNNP